MNIYIVFMKEGGAAVSTRYVDDSDKETLNGLGIPTAAYNPDHLGFDTNICDIAHPDGGVSRTQAAELFGVVIMDIDPTTKQLRNI